MAERRMFAKTIVTSDAFLDMPLSTRCLYFTLGMFADDDGFVNNPRSIMRQVGASIDDLNLLLAKKFVLSFESGVIVIKHWKINNYLRSDRYQETKYIDEKKQLSVDKNGSYMLTRYTSGIPNDYQMDTQDSIGKDSIDKIIEYKCDAKQVDNTPLAKIIITILLNDGSEFGIEEDYFNQMKGLFPGVDVLSELRKMSAWAINNPTKRKTKKGIKRFIGTWLSSAQDNATKNSNNKVVSNKGFQGRQYSREELNSLIQDIDKVEI